jgi:hypothetical protein
MKALLFSCENATCAVPEAYREIFRGAEEVLTSTAGWEPGALNLAQGFAMHFRTPLVHGDATRLLIDLEQDGDQRWSRYAMSLPEATRQRIVERHELPYRTQLQQRITEDLRRHAAVLHVLVHTAAATPGRVLLETAADAALAETIAAAWHGHLRPGELDVRHQRNAATNALGQSLARNFPAAQYAQIRLVVAQSFFLDGQPWRWEPMKRLLLESLAQVLAGRESVSVPAALSTAPR